MVHSVNKNFKKFNVGCILVDILFNEDTKLILTYLSKHGKNKNCSQDAILINDRVINNQAGNIDERLVCIGIADGVGGVPGGYEASTYILNHFAQAKSFHDAEELRKYLHSLNVELIDYASGMDEKKAMATTFTGLVPVGHELYYFHAGNTRLYAWIDDSLRQITTDHTNYQALLGQGIINKDDSTCERNVIYCCFGTGNPEYLSALEVNPISFDKAPEYFLMTTDGIHDYIDNCDMKQMLANNLDDRNKILTLIENAEKNGSSDDCSVIIARPQLLIY